MPDQLSVTAVEATIGLKTDDWKGRCYGVASLLLTHDLIKGDLRYGHWIGPTDPGSMFYNTTQSLGFCNHGWIEIHDGRVCDPTRWVFEDVDPYIYIGVKDFYDFGGNELRSIMHDVDYLPCPKSNDKETQVLDKLEGDAWEFIVDLIGGDTTLYESQAFEVANFSLNKLGYHAAAIYQALIDCKLGAYIPFDNRRFIMEKEFGKTH